MSSYSDSTAMRYPAPRQRSLSSLRAPSLLPDISEHSPSRTPSPPNQVFRRPTHVRSVSVASFLSDGTIEIEGFGFDNISELGDDSSIFGGESVYADSVLDGHDSEEGGIQRPHTPGDLSWRAERILANAKKKLDLCGQNISRARSSLILSPSTTPTSFHEQLDGVKAMPALHSHRLRMRNEEGAYSPPSPYWSNTHMRTNSESAVPQTRSGVNGTRSSSTGGNLNGDGLGTIADVDEHLVELERPQSEQSTSPSKSTQQMRVLRDQMKDLRGKITSLQQQAMTDSMRRRSVTSLRSTPNPYETHPAPTLDEVKYGGDSPIEPGETWENAEEIPDDYSSTSSGTPRAFRRSASSFEARHEDREDAFSYDALFYGNGIYAPSPNGSSRSNGRPVSYSSDGTESSATTVLEPPRIAAVRTTTRRDSFGSIESFATAAEDRSSSSESLRQTAALQHPTPPLNIPGEWLTPNANSSPRDDGYHSAPHTPRIPHHKDSSSSLSSSTTTHPPHPPKKAAQQKLYPIHPTPNYEPPTSIDAIVSSIPSASTAPISNSATSRKLHRKSAISIGQHHSNNALLLTGNDEIQLQLSDSDRELIENMIEGLGEVCCSMEMDQDQVKRGEYRQRLEGALRVLRGEVVMGVDGRRESEVKKGDGLKRERSVGGSWGGRYGGAGYRNGPVDYWVGDSDDECF